MIRPDLPQIYRNIADTIDTSEMYTVEQVLEWLRASADEAEDMES